MKISICGLTASAKTYQAKALAEIFDLEYISGSGLLLSNAGLKEDITHFWISDNGCRFFNTRNNNEYIDKKTDKMLLDIVSNNENIITDAWSLPFLYDGNDLFKIYLTPDLGSRAKIAYNSKEKKPHSINEIEKLIQLKDNRTRALFNKLYGIDIFNISNFDVYLDNSNLIPEQTTKILSDIIKKEYRL